MKSTRWLPVAAATFALGGGGFVYAQTGVHKAEDKSVMVMPYNITIDELEDMDIYGPDGKEIGEVDSVLVDGAAKPIAIAAEVGGFLGMGTRYVAIDPKAVTLTRQDEKNWKATMNANKDQLKAAPEYKYESEWRKL